MNDRFMMFSASLLLLFSATPANGVGYVPSVTLRNAADANVAMPIMGLGTGSYGDINGNGGEHWNTSVARNATRKWLQLGGKRIDTSLGYGGIGAPNACEVGVGLALKDLNVQRSDVFITSKLGCCTDSTNTITLGYDQAMQQMDMILKEIDTTYVDLLLIHWPGYKSTTIWPDWPCAKNQTTFRKCREETWLALRDIWQSGRARAIGVSNFEQNHLQELIDMGGPLPAVNQFEFHGYWHELDLVKFCQKYNITVNGYAPLGTPDHMKFYPNKWKHALLNDTDLDAIAKQYNQPPAQILLRWEMQLGLVVNPRTENPAHMMDNLEKPFSFHLTPETMDELAKLKTPNPEALNPENKVCYDPRLIP